MDNSGELDPIEFQQTLIGAGITTLSSDEMSALFDEADTVDPLSGMKNGMVGTKTHLR